ncbi:MAG: hypothetical protein Q8909_12755, partial [Bacteroidota bacterium]|nr:hypothetical protein [Bacteroidota bacterium]
GLDTPSQRHKLRILSSSASLPIDGASAEMLSDDQPYLLEVKVETKGMVYPMIPTGASISNILLGDK